MRHQVARGGILEIGEGELLDVREEIVPQVKLDVPRDDDDGLTGEEHEDAGDK